MMGWYHDGLGWGGWLLMTLAMIAFWGLVVVVVLALFRTESRSDYGTPRPAPRELLDERLVRGEITAEQYRALRDTLDRRGAVEAGGHRDEPVAQR